jgi:hypothetical protein
LGKGIQKERRDKNRIHAGDKRQTMYRRLTEDRKYAGDRRQVTGDILQWTVDKRSTGDRKLMRTGDRRHKDYRRRDKGDMQPYSRLTGDRKHAGDRRQVTGDIQWTADKRQETYRGQEINGEGRLET